MKRATGIQGSLFPPRRDEVPIGERGAIFTKRWVVELMLDLAGYLDDAALVHKQAIEPACGEGAFLIPMVDRLIHSCHKIGHPIADCQHALSAFELHRETAELCKINLVRHMMDREVPRTEAEALAEQWVHVGDFLGHSPSRPNADLIVGNPPYVRLEDLPEDLLAYYRSSYRTMNGRADVYIAFFEAALSHLRPGGTCAFICADRWMRNQYGAALRTLITREYCMETLIEMHEADGFETEVSAYPAITIIRKQKQTSVIVAKASPDLGYANSLAICQALSDLRQNKTADLPRGITASRMDGWFNGEEPWPLVSPDKLCILKRLEASFDFLESEATGTRVGIGVATGCDRVFITTDSSAVEASRLLPLALAEDTQSGKLVWSNHYLVNPWDSEGLVTLQDFPKLEQYYDRYSPLLKKRHCAQGRPQAWYKTIDRVDRSLLGKRKLYIPDIKGVLNPVLDEGQTYPHHNLYFIVSESWDLNVLGGLLISKIAHFFVNCYSLKMRGGYLRFQAQYLRRIRLPDPKTITDSQATGLREAFEKRDPAQATAIALKLYHLADFERELETVFLFWN